MNEQLVNVYRQLQTDVSAVMRTADKIEWSNHAKDYYYALRARYNEKILQRELDAECAVLLIYLTKNCFNGLYRVNSKGLFNTSQNDRHAGGGFESENISAIGRYLQHSQIEICCGDFEIAVKDAKAGDFVYFDSPYVPASETANFVSYAKGGFSWEDHERLAQICRDLSGKGVQWMLSNNDVPLVHELYGRFRIESVDVRRNINSKGDRRIGREVIVRNY